MRIKSVVVAGFILLSFASFGQKIKYKDLFPILNAKNYAQGGPQLVQYLSDPKKQDEANPNLQMGLMLEDRFLKYDIINDTSRIYATGDSAVTYLDRAKSLITEKELKKNDQYYQAFFRRDLRTGEFGIKVSDVHLDIEKKIEAINTRVEDIKELNRNLNRIDARHKKASDDYKSLTSKYDSYNQLLLAANEEDQTKLSSIEENGRLVSDKSATIKDMAQKLGSDKYQGEVEIKTIENFGQDGLESYDLKSGSITIWDFANWGRSAQSEIRGGIGLFKTMITNFSNEIREKKKKVKNSQNVDIGQFPSDLKEQLAKYDPESTVEKLLRIEMHEARVIKQVDLQLNPSLMDSSLIGSQLTIYTAAKAEVDSLNLLVESITTDDLESAKVKYKDYIESYFRTHGTASSYVSEVRTWSRRNKEWIGKSVQFWTDRNRWGVITKEGEEERSVPLFVQDAPEDGFFTLGLMVESIPEKVIYAADLMNEIGYIGSFGEDRREKWALEYTLPGTGAIQYEYDTIPSATGTVSFYIFNKNAMENNLSAVSFSLGGQLNWAVNVTAPRQPVNFKFDDLTQELTILFYPEEDLPLDSDELGYIVIDRTGNAR